MKLILLRDADNAAHAAMVDALMADNPNLRWASSYETGGGSVAFVDILEADAEEAQALARVLAGFPGAELLDVQASEMLRAPGSAPPG
jgi:hypothetical protein